MRIEIDNLSASYGKKKVLRNLSFSLEDGGLYAVMGANGCGKSTLLRCLSNLIVPDGGHVRIGERDIRTFSARELAQHIALVPQRALTDFEFSAFETVLMGRNPYQKHLQNESESDWAIVEQCMKLTNTWHLRFARPGEMSGGELQRVMLARALAQETPIMLLDEPLSNLDIAHQFDILHLLQGLPDKIILLVVHDLNMALEFCPNLLLLHEGFLLYQGATQQGLSPENIEKVFGVRAHLNEVEHRLMISRMCNDR